MDRFPTFISPRIGLQIGAAGLPLSQMDTEEGACKAKEGLNGAMNNGRFIKVHEASDRPDESDVENYIPRREFRKLY